MNRKLLLPLFFIVFVDLLGFSLILPLLPYYAESFGATPFIVGLLVASYAAAQLIGAPLLGRLSDRYGRRPILLLSVAGTFGGFLLLGFAQPVGEALARSLSPASANLFVVAVLFASRILDGLTGGNLSVAQAYIADVTDESSRAQGLGLIGAAFGLGFIIGPAAGGFLSTWGYSAPAFAAAALSFANLALIYVYLPESLSECRRAEIAALQAHRARTPLSLAALQKAITRPRVGPLLHIRVLFGLAFSIFQTVFALYAQYRLGFDARSTGYVLAYVGILAVFVQGFAIGRLAKHFSDKQLILGGLVIFTLSVSAWAFVPNLISLLIVMAPLAFAGGVLNVVLSSALSKSVYPEEIGGTLGLATSLESFTRILAPSLGGFLLQSLGTWAPGAFSGLLMLWVVWFAYRRLVLYPDPPLSPRPLVESA